MKTAQRTEHRLTTSINECWKNHGGLAKDRENHIVQCWSRRRSKTKASAVTAAVGPRIGTPVSGPDGRDACRTLSTNHKAERPARSWRGSAEQYYCSPQLHISEKSVTGASEWSPMGSDTNGRSLLNTKLTESSADIGSNHILRFITHLPS